MTAALHDRLADLVADAMRRLDEASGGAAVCTFTRAGVAVPGIKYAEGRWAALREAQRGVRTSSADASEPGTSLADVATARLAAWRAALDEALARSGTDWVAYRTGGVDALTELLTQDD